MTRLTVMEFARSDDAVWNLPRALMHELGRELPGVRFLLPETRAEADALLPETDVVFGWGVRRESFAAATRLRWVQISSAGVGSMLFPEFVASPIILTNASGLHARSMAEHALAMMLSFARKLHLARDEQHARRWAQDALWFEPPGFGQLDGSTLGVVGFGAIGHATAERARALGMTVLAVRRRPAGDPSPAHEQWGTDRLPELLERSDFVVLCAPLTPETRGMIGAAQLARMKPGAILINLGRGALVDEPALIDALSSGRIAGAGVDVVHEEPLPPASPLWAMPNVVLTPHVSGMGPRYWERLVELFARNLRAYLDGRPLANVVDKQAGY